MLGCTLSGPTLLKQVLCGPWLGMQVHKQGEILSKPRIFLKDLGSLELSSRAKGIEEMYGGVFAVTRKEVLTKLIIRAIAHFKSVRNAFPVKAHTEN